MNNKTDITITPQTKFPTNQTKPKLNKTKRTLSKPEIPALLKPKPANGDGIPPPSPNKNSASLKNPASSPPTDSPP